ncbi:dGTP triphosphohydrolase [Akkermansia muciniphila]|uniref:dGTP triphosphohydrolase n=1 Tax=Akkermansia muciniphila TaxID=239935 RepID=UPI000C9A2004|nr:dNTP triphosphohydrolase [Akkermansia muciniphila]PNC05885.1 deoxyguanosinetriphosphate triphosphohydrolase [Akkermansia muciniphila]
MSEMMNWQQLLSDIRCGSSHQSTTRSQKERNEYDKDYGRVLFSSAFRRLQDKTQVFPLGRNDYVRTRLTHSLEVAHIGSSLGMRAGNLLRKKRKELKSIIEPSKLATIVSTACLAHDIGNPPFGHSGEDAIETALKRHDLELPFEGNAQGFRILTRTGDPMEGKGLKLTSAVLGAFMKYPCTQSYSAAVEQGCITAINKLECKKFGIGEQEREAASFVADHLGLIPRSAQDGKNLCWCRHPLAYLMEAADDICYRIADIEDGYFSGILDFNHVRKLFSPFLTKKELQYMKDLIQKKEESSCVHYMRALAINKSIDAVVKTFIMYEEDLLQGKMAKSLIETSKLADSLKKLYDDAKENVYQSWEVIQVEAMGYKVLGELIDFFMEWVNNPTSGQSKKVAILLQAAKVFKDNEGREAREARLTHMLDYISGMTDSFALETYRKLTGIL